MTIAELFKKMMVFSDGNIHDIDHFIRVWSYAKTIGELEDLKPEDQFVLEAAALMHDIACPLCRIKYGNTNGKYQEMEGAIIAHDFLKDTDLNDDQIERIAYLIGHHHTFTQIEGIDYQILIEADYMANAEECLYPKENIRNFKEKYFKTSTGIQLLKALFQL